MFLFPSIEAAIGLLVLWLVPKRLTGKEIYNTWMTMVALTLATDVLLNACLKLYDLGSPKMDWQALLIEITLPPVVGVIFLNFMPSGRKAFMVYLLCVVPLSLFNEWLNVQARYINYRHWNLWLSAIVYLLGMVYLRWHLHFIRKKRKSSLRSEQGDSVGINELKTPFSKQKGKW